MKKEIGRTKRQAKNIKVHFIYPENYAMQLSNGALIQTNKAAGLVMMHFFFERPFLPESVVYSLDKKGSAIKVVEEEPSDIGSSIARSITSGIIMNKADAAKLYELLGKHLEFAEGDKAEPQPAKKRG